MENICMYVMSRLRGQTYVSSLHCFLQLDGSRYQSIYEPTEHSQPMMSDDVNDEDGPQHQELRPLLFFEQCVGS